MISKPPQTMAAGQWTPAFLSIFLWLLVAATVGVTVRGAWRFPVRAAAHAGEMDGLFKLILSITGVAFITAQLLLGYLILRFRVRDGEPARHDGQRASEWIIVLVPACLLMICDLVIELRSDHLWSSLRGDAPHDAMTLELTAEQFNWTIRYPGNDGKFGRTQAKLITDDNMVGIDPQDLAGKDDLVLDGIMHLPAGRAVRILLHSKDVLHAFWVPHFRLKQDCMPGFEIPIWFTPTRVGEYEIACAELCGMGHYKMRAALTVEPPEAFDKWLQEQTTFASQ